MGTDSFPNEPAGFTRVAELSFRHARADGWTADTSANFRLVQDELAPRSPPYVGEAVFPAGWAGGYEPMWVESPDLSTLGLTKLYVTFWLKLSPNWQGHESSFNKIGYVWIHNSAVVFPVIFGRGRGPLRTGLGLQDIPVVVARNLEQNLRRIDIKRGHWHRWEILLISNTPRRANGEAHWWIDGVKVGEYKRLRYADRGQDNQWQLVTWRPVWGGGGDVVEDKMFMRMDHFYVSGRR